MTVTVSALLADFEPDVDAAVVVRAERDGLLLVRLEPAELDLHVVGAGEEAGRRGTARDASLTVDCAAFVPALVSVTVAPGRTPPLES